MAITMKTMELAIHFIGITDASDDLIHYGGFPVTIVWFRTFMDSSIHVVATPFRNRPVRLFVTDPFITDLVQNRQPS